MGFFDKLGKKPAGKPEAEVDKVAPESPSEDPNETWGKLQAEHEAQAPEKSAQDSVADSGFLTAATSNFQEPDFKADIDSRAERIDVTPVDTSPTRTMDETEFAHIQASAATSRDNGADLNAMRLDVARISADIQSGEELYRRAQRRIENLTGFVERAEIDFSLLNRLEPENRRLKARNRTLEKEIDERIREAQVLKDTLDDHRARLNERNAAYDELQGRMSLASKSLREHDSALRASRDTSDRNALAAERAETSLTVEKRENEILRTKIVEMTTTLEEKNSGYLEAKKMADSLAQDCTDFRLQATEAQGENLELRNAFDEAQRQNNQMKAEMVSLHEDIRNFKTQYEFNVISREDEITALQGQIEALNKQLGVKDEIVRNAARDVTELRKIRTAQDLERERLESLIEAQSYQLEESQSELLKSKRDVTEFDRRYRDVADALSMQQVRRTNSTPSETPDIRPNPEPQPDAMPLSKASDLHIDEIDIDSQDVLSDDEIMDRVTDYKLGNRKDLG